MKRQLSLQRKFHSEVKSTLRVAVVVLAGMKSKAALVNSGEVEDGDGEPSDHFEGDPRPLPYAFEKEIINKSNKHIRICEKFVPSNRVYPITTKFYAKYEPQPISIAQPQRHRHTKPNTDYPLLESQVYGWIPLQCQEAATYLNCIHAPKRRCRMTRHGELITAGRITERPPFNGLKFIIH